MHIRAQNHACDIAFAELQEGFECKWEGHAAVELHKHKNVYTK